MLSMLLAATLTAAPQAKVVSLDWQTSGVKPELARLYADTLGEALRARGLSLLTSQDVQAVLGLERQRQLLGCAEEATSCVAEIASAMGSDALMTVTLARLDDGSLRGLAKVLSAKTGAVLSSVKLDARGERELLDSFDDAAAVLAAPFSSTAGPPGVTKEGEAGGARRFWWIPAAAGAAGAGVGVALFVISAQTYGALDDRSLTLADARELASRGEGLQRAAWISTSIGVAALLSAGALYLFGAPAAPRPVVTLGASGVSLGVAGTW